MSSLFSDPGWRRGGTLLGGETIELDANSNPVAGRDLVGQVKVFQDQNPDTGAIKSNRLVYCVAARYTGSASLTSADAGKLYKFDVTNENSPLTEFKDLADTANVADGQAVGVLDEYIGEGVTVRQNDVVWLVVKGPTTVAKKTGGTLAIGAVAFTQANADAGLVRETVSNAIKVGQVLASAASDDTSVRVNVVSDHV